MASVSSAAPFVPPCARGASRWTWWHWALQGPPAQLAAGPKTVADAWALLPYENQIVTLELTRDDLLAFVRDLASVRDVRNAMGVRPLLDPASQISGGDGIMRAATVHRCRTSRAFAWRSIPMMRNRRASDCCSVARLAQDPENRRVLHQVEIRAALIDFFLTPATGEPRLAPRLAVRAAFVQGAEHLRLAVIGIALVLGQGPGVIETDDAQREDQHGHAAP